MPRKARPIVISPQTRARDLRDIDGVIVNRGSFRYAVHAAPSLSIQPQFPTAKFEEV